MKSKYIFIMGLILYFTSLYFPFSEFLFLRLCFIIGFLSGTITTLYGLKKWSEEERKEKKQEEFSFQKSL